MLAELVCVSPLLQGRTLFCGGWWLSSCVFDDGKTGGAGGRRGRHLSPVGEVFMNQENSFGWCFFAPTKVALGSSQIHVGRRRVGFGRNEGGEGGSVVPANLKNTQRVFKSVWLCGCHYVRHVFGVFSLSGRFCVFSFHLPHLFRLRGCYHTLRVRWAGCLFILLVLRPQNSRCWNSFPWMMPVFFWGGGLTGGRAVAVPSQARPAKGKGGRATRIKRFLAIQGGGTD